MSYDLLVTLDGGQLADFDANMKEQGFEIIEIPTWVDTLSDGSLVWLIKYIPVKE